MYYSVIGDGRADTVEWKQQLMQLFFPMSFGMLPIHIPLRTKEAAEQCPALRVAVTLAERRNPSCEVLKRCSARLVTVRDDNYLPTCSETPWQLVIFHILPSFSLVVLTTDNKILFLHVFTFQSLIATQFAQGCIRVWDSIGPAKSYAQHVAKHFSFFLLLLSSGSSSTIPATNIAPEH